MRLTIKTPALNRISRMSKSFTANSPLQIAIPRRSGWLRQPLCSTRLSAQERPFLNFVQCLQRPLGEVKHQQIVAASWGKFKAFHPRC